MNLILNFNNTLEKKAITFQVAKYGSPLKKINKFSGGKQQMTSFLEFYQYLSCYTGTVYKVILKDDLVEKKVNNNVDQ